MTSEADEAKPALQWGHDLAVMESVHAAAGELNDIAQLQWGHDLAVMESPLVRDLRLHQPHASMGP